MFFWFLLFPLIGLVIFFIFFAVSLADAYDPLDPHGNITINWDFQAIDTGGYTVRTCSCEF